MRFRVLGPLGVVAEDAALSIGGPKQRLVLALLLLDAPRSVSTGNLMEGVWNDDQPDTARKTLQGYVHHLRAKIGDAITTDATGYRLDIDRETIDAVEFEALVADARLLTEESPEAASEMLTAALGMWTGQPYADLDGSLALEPEISRLKELRLGAIEDRISADLVFGATGSLIGELESLTRDYPFRERFRALHMRALYMNGRQSEALRAFDDTRRLMGEELGLEPSRELKELEEGIFNDNLEVPVGSTPRGFMPRGVRGYELRGADGSGAVGTVHRAYQMSLGRQVSLKIFRSDVADAPSFIEHFADEVQRIGALEHDHIVPLYDAWREPGAAYQAYRWMSGGSLRSWMDREQLSGATAMRILEEVGTALEHAHRQGFNHCRVKPTNVVLDENERAYLTDFAVVGTEMLVASDDDRMYQAPELTTGGGSTPGTDVYSLGILAHELLSGQQPKKTASGLELSPQLPAEFIEDIHKATLPAAAHRFGRVEALVRALKQSAGIDVTAAAVTMPSATRSDLRNPYKGLRAFQEADADDFFGREDFVEQLLATLRTTNLVAVVGPSGIGKSSAVKAGAIPALRRQRDPSDPRVLVTEMFPGTHPFEELAAALLRVAVVRPAGLIDDLMADDRGLLRVAKQILPNDGSELLLVIDQFEELFTLVSDEGRRQLFLQTLVAVAGDDRSRVRVIVTMRADFFDRPLEYHEFGQLIERGGVTMMVPSQEGLAQAIAGPARAVGVDLEPGLVSEIVHDVMNQPGGLPLMQYALTELFESRQADVLTIDGYRDTGGVLGALGTRAEELWQSLGAAGQEATRQAFLRLVTVDEGSGDTRRRVRRSELAGLGLSQQDLNAAITLFGAHRLLTFDRDPFTRGPTVEVAHEALLREWPRLRGWIDDQRADLIQHRLLTTELAEWEAAGRESSYLLRGGRLDQFEQWERASGLSLTSAEKGFLEGSRELRTSDEAKELTTQRRLRSMLVGAIVLAIVALSAGVVALFQAQQSQNSAESAQESAREAEIRRLALQAPQLADTNRQVALLLAVEAYSRNPEDPVTLGALQDVFVNTGAFLGYYVPDGRPRGIGFTSDDDLVVLSGTSIRVYDMAEGITRGVIAVPGARLSEVSPMADLVAAATGETVRIFDIATMTELVALASPTGSPITSMTFDENGERLAIGDESGTVSVHPTHSNGLSFSFEAHPAGSCPRVPVPPHLPDLARIGTRALSFSDDGELLATGGEVCARVWDLTANQPTLVYETVHERRAPDGSRLNAAVRAVRIVGAPDARLYVASSVNVAEHDFESGFVRELEFPDRLAAIGPGVVLDSDVVLTDNSAILAELGGRTIVMPLNEPTITEFDAHLTGVPHVAVSADGQTVAVSGDAGVASWSLDGRGLLSVSVPRFGANETTMTTDAEWLILNGPVGTDITLVRRVDGAYQQVDMRSATPLQSGHAGEAKGFVTWSLEDQATRFHEFADITSAGQVIGTVGAINSFAYSADGTIFAAGMGSETTGIGAVVQVYDLATLEPASKILTDLVVAEPEGEAAPSRTTVLSLSFSPDATRLVGVNSEGGAVIWETESWTVERVLSQGGGLVVLAEYSPDGRFLVTTASDGTTLLRDPETLEQVGTPLIGQTSGFQGFSAGPTFTLDGEFMITTADGTGRIWSLDERAQVGTGFPSHPNSIPSSSRNGRWLLTYTRDNLVIWDLDFSQWVETACRAAGRNLSISEWEQFAPANEGYRATCDRWPAANE